MPEEPKKEDLRAEVDALKAHVKKLTVMLAQTGQQLLQMQMQQRRDSVLELDSKNKELQQAVGHYQPSKDNESGGENGRGRRSDLVTEADLEEMVMELQGQLTIIDNRSQGRVRNSRATKEDDLLIALPNADGAIRPDFPKTLGDVSKLTDEEIFVHWSHFEMLPGVNKLSDLLDDGNAESNSKVVAELYESLCHYIGIEPPERK